MLEQDKKTLDEIISKSFNGDASALVAFVQQHYLNLNVVPKQAFTKNAPIKADAPVIVNLQNVTKLYKSKREQVRALDDINLEIKEGEIVAIVGPSGSGKSTMMHIIAGMDKPTSGNVVVNGTDLRQLSDRGLSSFRNSTIGFVFQLFYLQPFLTVFQNTEIPLVFRKTPIKERAKYIEFALNAVGLGDRMQHLPSELSGGQMQRTAIARAVVGNPKILVADEPTANIDRENAEAVINLFKEINSKLGTTIILVTHDDRVAEVAHRIVNIRDGKIIS